MSARKAANKRNAKLSKGPRTPQGKARSSLNALKHGLTAQLPPYVLEQCKSDHAETLDFVVRRSPGLDLTDGVCILAGRQKLKTRRSQLLDQLASAALLDSTDVMSGLLRELGRLETYERKSHSRWARLIAGA